MPENEGGLYYLDGSYKSDKQLKYENLDSPVLIREKTKDRAPTLDEWTEEFVRRRELRQEFEALPEEIDITIETNQPIIVATIGDIHGGGTVVDYELLREHVRFVAAHPNAYAILGGDLIDGFFFNPAQDQQLASWNEQRMFSRSVIDELKGKILFFEEGDHDMWSEKMGPTIYNQIREETGIPVVRGSSRCNLHLPDVTYKIVSAHQLPGHSMYNDTHPEMREARFGTQGGDIYIGFHTHRKSFHKQVVDMFDEAKEQLYISSGSYKYSDEYAKKKGWAQQRAAKRGAVFVVLYPFVKRMDAFNSHLEAGSELQKAM
jgi:hypothetical protein